MVHDIIDNIELYNECSTRMRVCIDPYHMSKSLLNCFQNAFACLYWITNLPHICVPLNFPPALGTCISVYDYNYVKPVLELQKRGVHGKTTLMNR